MTTPPREIPPRLELKVHLCGFQGADEACGLCTVGHDCSTYANVVGDLSYDECHHPMDHEMAEHLVRLYNAEAQVVEAIRRARNGFVSCYTKVGNVRAWRGTAEDIDWLTKTLDAALALLRGDRPGGDCLGCYPAATKIVLGCPVHDRPGEGGE